VFAIRQYSVGTAATAAGCAATTAIAAARSRSGS